MAPPAGTLRVSRYFAALLALIAVLYLIVFWPGSRHTPKLGLDLQGGQQIIFTAKTADNKTPAASQMSQAKQIMTDRVNGSGVTEATVVIQGSDQIVVSIPGSSNQDISKLGAAAKLNFRGLVAPAVAVACTPPTGATSAASPTASPGPAASPTTSPTGAASASPASASASPNDAGHARLGKPLAAPSPTSTPTATGAPAATGTANPTAPATRAATPCTASPFAALEKAGTKIPVAEDDWNALDSSKQQSISTAMATFDCASAQTERDIADSYYLACDSSGTFVYLLGPVIVPGTEVKSASAQAPNPSQGQTQYTVAVDMKSSGAAAWAKYTSAHNTGGADNGSADPSACGASTFPCAYWVGITLDGVAISVPINEAAINGGSTQISGSFTSQSASDLANKLKYGALPLSFKAETAQTISATLGTSQLKSGLLAGGIGLILVVLYSLIYYRALGLVTIASLIVSGILTYGSLVMLGEQIDFTLSLAGIAGFIVAVGITADSFVVFFERIKDEVHEGRSARVAIPRAWVRARRTIISADVVSFLAAAILYYFAAGDVKGFAFTLGLSTIIDIAVVFLFTHPLVSLFSRSRVFGSRRFTGLDAIRSAGTGSTVAAPDEDAVFVGPSGQTAAERAAARRERLRREQGEV